MATTTTGQLLLNKDVFRKDPTETTIPNLGVSKVVEPTTQEEWDVLDYELTSFVCDGEYEAGLDRVLSTFLASLDKPQQPAVWVSGFYGSGKSHFARVLEFLWRDIEFPDGQTARSKVSLPDRIREHLRELTIAGRRHGGLWSAGGTLSAGAGNSVRLAMLGIVFRSAGLPTQYGRARFALWLKQEGIEHALADGLQVQGRTLDGELQHMYVSSRLHEALLAARPGFAATQADVAALLQAQFPAAPSDVSDEDFLEAIEAVLRLKAEQAGQPGRFPLTLIVFDELQQFIGDDSTRTLHVQQVVEACSSRFGSRLLFLGTGQAQMQDTPQLQKLQGRFTVRVMLRDADVERVVREVVLLKDQSKVAALEEVLERASGEINRHLVETRIGATSADREALVADYPLLPTRRRFWEAVLRTVDTTGTAGTLRTQLKIVQEATKEIAGRPLGHVIGGDEIFDQLQGDMLQSAKLPRETNEFIVQQGEDGTPDGRLRARLCGTIFLIGELPRSGVAATGLRATAGNLADLLVEDLTAGSADLRRRIPEVLGELVESGRLMDIEGEYRLQTREGMQWEREFQERTTRVRNDEARIADARTKAIRAAVEKELAKLTFAHGASTTPRAIDLHFGQEAPSSRSDKVPVWVRDEWSVSEKAVLQEAQAAGPNSPIVFVVLPRRHAEDLKSAVARAAAAEETINAKGVPATDEGRQARTAMQSRLQIEQEKIASLVGSVVQAATVYQGGGSTMAEGSLRVSVQAAFEASLARLFPDFKDADFKGWETVAKRAREGAGDPLGAVGYAGDPANQPACRKVAAYIGGAGKKGSEVRDRFKNPPYGWSQDAIDGALLTLLAANLIRASRHNQPLLAKALTTQAIPAADYFGEETPLTQKEMMELRGLLTDLGRPVDTNEAARTEVRVALTLLSALAAEAGGSPPLPAPPSTTYLADLLSRSGNDQVKAVLEAGVQVRADHKAWQAAKIKIAHRLPRWQTLLRLLRHGEGRTVTKTVQAQVDAILANRSLLSEPDPIAPLHHDIAADLRAAVRDARDRMKAAQDREIANLEQTPEWVDLPNERWQPILAINGLGPVPEVEVGTDDALLTTLDATPLTDWDEKVIALPQRVAIAREAAARELEPKTVKVRPKTATLKTPDQVDIYLAALREEIMRHIEAGHPVIV